MGQSTITGNIVVEYLNNFPNANTLSLSRKIYKENKPVFNSLEHVRETVRYYRGALGKQHKKELKQEKIFTTPAWNIPDDDNEPYDVYYIDPALKSGLLLADIHFPYHDKPALLTALEFGYKTGVDFVLLNGDILDFYQISHFMRDPRKKNIAEEILQLESFLSEIRKNLSAKIIFKFGNHEERYDKYILMHAAELFNLDAIRLPKILKLEESGIEVIDRKRVIKYRELSVLHGHEYKINIQNPVNPARGIFLRARVPTIINHFHQASEHSETDLDGEVTTCWSVGCMCGLHPEYAPLNKWTHGFARIKALEDNYWRVENKRIIDGKIV